MPQKKGCTLTHFQKWMAKQYRSQDRFSNDQIGRYIGTSRETVRRYFLEIDHDQSHSRVSLERKESPSRPNDSGLRFIRASVGVSGELLS